MKDSDGGRMIRAGDQKAVIATFTHADGRFELAGVSREVIDAHIRERLAREGRIAGPAMEANHPNLTTAKAFYVEISRARDRAEPVTDDAAALKERLEAVTGERISALEGIGESVLREHGKDANTSTDKDRPEALAGVGARHQSSRTQVLVRSLSTLRSCG